MHKEKLEQKEIKIPNLRFPGFDGGWEEKKFEDTFDFLKTNSFSRAELSEDGDVINIHYGDIHKSDKCHFDIQKEKLPYLKTDNIKTDYIQDGDIVIADASEDRFDIGKAVEILNTKNLKVVSGLHTFLVRSQNIALGFSGFLLRTNNLKKNFYKISTGASVLGISKTEVSRIIINLPSIQEQQKIASFLGSVDEWVQNLKTQKENLEQYKKGMMQKIFSQKIRFQDENGKDFPDWEEKKLEEVAEIYQPQTISQSDLSDDEKYEVWGANGVIGKYSKYNHEFEQVIVTCRGSTCGTVNFTKPFSWITGNAMVLNIDESNKILKKFLFYYLNNDNLNYLISGSGQPQITGNIKKHKIRLPLIQEQQKITSFLTSLDNLIQSKQIQLTQAENWKKGLMQKMFI